MQVHTVLTAFDFGQECPRGLLGLFRIPSGAGVNRINMFLLEEPSVLNSLGFFLL